MEMVYGWDGCDGVDNSQDGGIGDLPSTEVRRRPAVATRDLPGSTVLSDTVIRASEAAQRTIVIVSPNFLKTEWSRYDYKSGLLQAVNNGTKKVIFVILGNIDNSLLEPNLREQLHDDPWSQKLRVQLHGDPLI